MDMVDVFEPLVQEQGIEFGSRDTLEKTSQYGLTDRDAVHMDDEAMKEAIMELYSLKESILAAESEVDQRIKGIIHEVYSVGGAVEGRPELFNQYGPSEKLLPSIVKAPVLELKKLPKHLQYAYLGPEETLPVIISADLTMVQEERLVRVLRENKEAIGWTLADIKGISPTECMHHIYLEEGAKPVRDSQRKMNPAMKEVVLKEILKLLELGIIYPISDSQWVSPVHVVPKKSGIQVVENDKGELVPTRLQTGWRVCIDYRRLNEVTRKDHFPLPFIDQMLERLAGNA